MLASLGFAAVLPSIASAKPGPDPNPNPDPNPDPDPDRAPLWPLPGVSRKGKPTPMGSFGARRWKKNRDGKIVGKRHHTGVDLGAPEGAPVVAPESGVVSGHQGWAGPGARALLLHTDTGATLVFGALRGASRAPVGKRVERGGQVGEVGIYPGGDTMLHLERLVNIDGSAVRPRERTRLVKSWEWGHAKPPGILDVGEYVEGMVDQ